MKAGRRKVVIAVFMLTWCTFRQQMGRPVLKLTAMLSHAEKVNNLAMLYCRLEVERFPTMRRRRFLDGIPKSAERVCVYPSDSQVSAVTPKWVLQYPDQNKNQSDAGRETALGGMCIRQAGLGWAQLWCSSSSWCGFAEPCGWLVLKSTFRWALAKLLGSVFVFLQLTGATV